jgi:hypothetical protein
MHGKLEMTGEDVVNWYFDQIAKHRASGDNVYFRGERINKIDWKTKTMFMRGGGEFRYSPLKKGTKAEPMLEIFRTLGIIYGERKAFFDAMEKTKNRINKSKPA